MTLVDNALIVKANVIKGGLNRLSARDLQFIVNNPLASSDLKVVFKVEMPNGSDLRKETCISDMSSNVKGLSLTLLASPKLTHVAKNDSITYC